MFCISNESVHHQGEVASQHASTVGTAGSKASKSMSVLNNAVKHATDGFIGILDMFGFEDPKVSIICNYFGSCISPLTIYGTFLN